MINLTAYKVFEPVRMNGLLNGDMLAQAEVGTIPTKNGVVENGTLTNFGIDGKLNLAANKEKLFVVYNEPKHDFWVGDEYFAVDLEYELPRAIRLWTGDKFITNNVDADLAGAKYAKIVSGKLTLEETNSADSCFIVEETYTASGIKAYMFTYVL